MSISSSTAYPGEVHPPTLLGLVPFSEYRVGEGLGQCKLVPQNEVYLTYHNQKLLLIEIELLKGSLDDFVVKSD